MCFVFCPVSFLAQLAEAILHLTVFFWAQPAFTGIFRSLPGACLQLTATLRRIDSSDFSGGLGRVMWTDKQSDCCLYSSHDGSRDCDLRSFGSMGCARAVVVVVLMRPDVVLYHNKDIFS